MKRSSGLTQELLPHARCVGLQGSCSSQRPKAPHLPEELLLREDAVRLGRELHHELELLRRETDRDVPHQYAARGPVDLEVSGDDHIAAAHCSSQQGADPRKQLLVRERSADDVVRPAVESANALDRIGRLRDHDDRNISIPGPSGLTTAKPQAQVELAEEDNVRPRSLDELERLAATRCTQHVEPVVAQLLPEILAGVGLGLGDEDGARHDDDASRHLRAAPDVRLSESVTNTPQASRRIGTTLECGYNLPWRRIPQTSQIPKTPEMRKPKSARRLIPSACGPPSANTPMIAEPSRPPTTTSATARRFDA